MCCEGMVVWVHGFCYILFPVNVRYYIRTTIFNLWTKYRVDGMDQMQKSQVVIGTANVTFMTKFPCVRSGPSWFYESYQNMYVKCNETFYWNLNSV